MIERPPSPDDPDPTAAAQYRILIVAVSPSAREALRWALECEPDLLVVGEAADGPAALAGNIALRPDVVLLDLAYRGAGRGAGRHPSDRKGVDRKGADPGGTEHRGADRCLADITAITRTLKAVADPPLVLLLATAGDPRERTLYLRAGGDGLLEKGAGWPALVQEMRRALRQRARAGAHITADSPSTSPMRPTRPKSPSPSAREEGA